MGCQLGKLRGQLDRAGRGVPTAQMVSPGVEGGVARAQTEDMGLASNLTAKEDAEAQRCPPVTAGLVPEPGFVRQILEPASGPGASTLSRLVNNLKQDPPAPHWQLRFALWEHLKNS